MLAAEVLWDNHAGLLILCELIGLSARAKIIPAAGLMDTEFRCFMKPKVGHA